MALPRALPVALIGSCFVLQPRPLSVVQAQNQNQNKSFQNLNLQKIKKKQPLRLYTRADVVLQALLCVAVEVCV